MSEAHAEATVRLPRPAKIGPGLSFNPLGQFSGFQLVGPVELQLDYYDWTRILPNNPGRLAWYALPSDLALTAVRFSVDEETGHDYFDNGIPNLGFRCHSAEWPMFCQHEWFAWAFNDDLAALPLLKVWEVVGL